MKWFLIILAVFSLFFVGISFLSIRIHFVYKRDGENDEMVMEISTLQGFIKFKIELPAVDFGMKFLRPFIKVKVEAEGKSGKPLTKGKQKIPIPSLEKMHTYLSKFLYYLTHYKSVFMYFNRHTHFYRLKWHTEFGFYDPAATGVLAGVAWTLKGYIYSLFKKNTPYIETRPEIAVIPNFQQTKLRLDINCIFDIKIGHIITGTFLFVSKYLTRKGV